MVVSTWASWPLWNARRPPFATVTATASPGLPGRSGAPASPSGNPRAAQGLSPRVVGYGLSARLGKQAGSKANLPTTHPRFSAVFGQDSCRHQAPSVPPSSYCPLTRRFGDLDFSASTLEYLRCIQRRSPQPILQLKPFTFSPEASPPPREARGPGNASTLLAHRPLPRLRRAPQTQKAGEGHDAPPTLPRPMRAVREKGFPVGFRPPSEDSFHYGKCQTPGILNSAKRLTIIKTHVTTRAREFTPTSKLELRPHGDAPKATPASPRLRRTGGARRARPPLLPRPRLPPLSGKPALTNWGVQRQARVVASSILPPITVATFGVRHCGFSSLVVSPSFLLLGTQRAPRAAASTALTPRACSALARPRLSCPRAPSPSRSSITWLARKRRRGSRRAGSLEEGA